MFILAYRQTTRAVWASNSLKCARWKSQSVFQPLKEEANCKNGLRRVEGRCLQKSRTAQEFCSVAWQQVIICQCAASTCQQPKPTQAASTGTYMRQLQASSIISLWKAGRGALEVSFRLNCNSKGLWTMHWNHSVQEDSLGDARNWKIRPLPY